MKAKRGVDFRYKKVICCEKCGSKEKFDFILSINKWLCKDCAVAVIKK